MPTSWIPLIFLALFLGASPLFAQNQPALSIRQLPVELLENAHDIIRLEDRRLTLESSRTAYLYCRKVVTILSRESSQDVLYLPYDKESRVTQLSARVYDAAGNLVRKIGSSEIEDYSAISDFSIYEDSRYKYLKVAHNTYPYTIEFEYGLTAQGITMCVLPNWQVQSYHSSIQKASYLIKVPNNLKIHCQTLNFQEVPVVQEGKGMTTYHWEIKHKTAQQPEEYSPNTAAVLPKLLVSLDQFQIDQYTGSFRSWKDFGLFIYQLSEKKDQLSPSMYAKVQSLTAKAVNNREKVTILYHYLQQNMRYVSVQLGIGGWQPFSAAYVEQNKYGDCKALTNFMKALLKAANIPAYPVLIHSSKTPIYPITKDFATSRFNHVILRIPSENIWLECTSTNYPVNYIGQSNANRTALMITSQGGELVETPSYAATNQEQNHFQIYLDEEGGASIQGIIHSKGSKHEIYRAVASHYTQEDFKKWYQKKSALPSFQLEQFKFEAAQDSPSCQLQLTASIPRYGAKTGKRLFVPLNKINPFSNQLPTYEERQQPVVLHHGFTEQDSFVFHLPQGYQLESAPEQVELHSPFGYYKLTITIKENQVLIKRQFTLQATEQAADKYAVLQDFFKIITKSDAGNMVLVKKIP